MGQVVFDAVGNPGRSFSYRVALLSGFVGVSRLRSDTTLEWYLICMRDKQAVLPADDVVFSLASSEKNSNSQGRENVVAVSIGSAENATCSTAFSCDS